MARYLATFLLVLTSLLSAGLSAQAREGKADFRFEGEVESFIGEKPTLLISVERRLGERWIRFPELGCGYKAEGKGERWHAELIEGDQTCSPGFSVFVRADSGVSKLDPWRLGIRTQGASGGMGFSGGLKSVGDTDMHTRRLCERRKEDCNPWTSEYADADLEPVQVVEEELCILWSGHEKRPYKIEEDLLKDDRDVVTLLNLAALSPSCVMRPEGFERWTLQLTGEPLGGSLTSPNLKKGMYLTAAVWTNPDQREDDPSSIIRALAYLPAGRALRLECMTADLKPCKATVENRNADVDQPELTLTYSAGNPRGEQLAFFLNLERERRTRLLKGRSTEGNMYWDGYFSPGSYDSLTKTIEYGRLLGGYAVSRVMLLGKCGADVGKAALSENAYVAVNDGLGRFKRWEARGMRIAGTIDVPPGFEMVFNRIGNFRDWFSEEEYAQFADVLKNYTCSSPELRQMEQNMVSFIHRDFIRQLVR